VPHVRVLLCAASFRKDNDEGMNVKKKMSLQDEKVNRDELYQNDENEVVFTRTNESDDGSYTTMNDVKSNNGGQFEVVHQQTKKVRSLKLLLIGTLIVSAAGLGYSAFAYMRGIEVKKFNSAFQNDAFLLRQSIATGIEQAFLASDLMATNILIHARSTNATWPYVTLPGFHELAAKASITCIHVQLYTAVVVQPWERLKWENYSWDNRYTIINETNEFMASDVNYHGTVFWDVQPSRSIFSSEGPIPYNET
jgi:hypothetical protein